MKKGMLSIVFVLMLSGLAWPGSVILEWDPNNETDLKGYHIYRAERLGDHSTAWKKIGTVSKDITTYTDEVDNRNYAWQVTAYNVIGQESFPSNMVERFDRTPPMTVENCRKAPN